MADQLRISEWDESYDRKENFLFLPGDEVIRFVARYLRRRTDIDTIRDVLPGAAGSRVLDVGCGIGRNILFGHNMGLDMYGNDLSAAAVAKAVAWLAPQIGSQVSERIIVSDIRALSWDSVFFDHAMSDSVLDSMPFEIARSGMSEVARVIKPGGLFYCSLISGDETGRDPEFCDEKQVSGTHERNTIQSYFNYAKIKRLLEPLFEIRDCFLTQVRNPVKNTHEGRWHVVSRRH